MSRNPDNPGQLEQVFNSVDPIEVAMARDLLQGSGIDCFVFDLDASRMLGSTAAITARLMVRAEDAAEARRRLRDLGFDSV